MAYPPRHLARGRRGILALDHNTKFVAIQARDQRRVPANFDEALSGGANHLFTVGVAQHVNNDLEFVEANHEERNFCGVRLGVRKCVLQMRNESVTICKARQRIIFRQIADARGFALPDRDVAQDRAIVKSIRARPA